MPELNWNELDLIECLEVIPTIGEYKEWFGWEVIQERVKLLITIWPLESAIQISLFDTQSNSAIMEFAAFVRDVIEHKKQKNSSYLRLRNCVIVPSRFYYQEVGNIFDQTRWAHGLDIKITIKPQVQIELVSSAE